MFVRVSTLVLAIAAAAIAAPSPATTATTPIVQCNTGLIQCCNQVYNSTDAGELSGLLGLFIPITGLIGVDCTPISVLGAGTGAACEQQPLCCEGNQQYGLFNVDCTPINVNL